METIGRRAGSKRKVLTPRRLTQKSQSVQVSNSTFAYFGRIQWKWAQLLEHRTFVSESRPVIQEQITSISAQGSGQPLGRWRKINPTNLCLFEEVILRLLRMVSLLYCFRRIPKSYTCRPTLGYYSSWPLFALTHHLVIWWCEEQVYPDRYFDRYAVLGDDVVIADQTVAQEYEKALQNLGVKISHQKYFISESGAAEFAKRFHIRGLSVDLSPISIRALMNPFHPYGLIQSVCLIWSRDFQLFVESVEPDIELFRDCSTLDRFASRGCLVCTLVAVDLWIHTFAVCS